MPFPFVAFSLWLFFLFSLTFLFWLRPLSFFSQLDGKGKNKGSFELSGNSKRRNEQLDFPTVMAASLAILLFLSCFILGIWLSLAKLKGVL